MIKKQIEIANSFIFVEGFILIFLNSVSFCIIVTSRNLRSSFYNILLSALFLSHLLNGICIIIYISFDIWSDVYSKGYTGAIIARDCAISLEINFSILLSFERFIAVRKPFFYAKLTKIHGIASIGVAIGLTTFFTIFSIFSAKAYLSAFIVITSGGIFIIISNFLLYRSVKKQCSQIAATIVDRSTQKQNEKRNEIRKRQLKSLKICLFIASSYILTWFPLIAVAIGNQKTDTSLLLRKIFAVVSFSNGIWDVLIFFALNAEARRQLMQKIFGRKTVLRKFSDRYITEMTIKNGELLVN